MKGGKLFFRHAAGSVEEFDASLEGHCLMARAQKIIHVPVLIHGYLSSSDANEINFSLFDEELVKLCKTDSSDGIYSTPLYPDSRLKAVITCTIEEQAELVCNSIKGWVLELVNLLENVDSTIHPTFDVIGTSQGAAVGLEVWDTICNKWKFRSRFFSINGGVSNGCAIIDALYPFAQRYLPIGAKSLAAKACRDRFLPKSNLLNKQNCFFVGSRSKEIVHVIDAFVPRRIPNFLRTVLTKFIEYRMTDSDGVFSVENQIPPELKDNVNYFLFENVNHFDPISHLAKDVVKTVELNKKFAELYWGWCKKDLENSNDEKQRCVYI